MNYLDIGFVQFDGFCSVYNSISIILKLDMGLERQWSAEKSESLYFMINLSPVAKERWIFVIYFNSL